MGGLYHERKESGEGIALRQSSARCEIPLSAISRQSPFAKLMEVVQADERLELVETRRQVILERMAAVIGLTYAELGDGAPLTDDEALDMIRDLLLDYDDHIITRNYERGYGEIVIGKLRQRMTHAR